VGAGLHKSHNDCPKHEHLDHQEQDTRHQHACASIAYACTYRTEGQKEEAQKQVQLLRDGVARSPSEGPRDLAANPLASDFSWSFTTESM
jgi:hypothetical protein